MSDVKCPYCGAEQEINHDDGYGCDESGENEQECVSCTESFKFTTSISYDYEVLCHEGDHVLEQSGYEKCESLYSCKNCDYYEVRR